jgi:hypothetical protein
MSIQDKLNTLKAEVLDFTQQIVRVLSKKPTAVELSDDSPHLNNRTPAQMQADVDTLTTAHAARTDNPHKLNGTILTAYTDTELNAKVNALVRVNTLPVSQYGSLDNSALPASYTGTTLRITAQVPLILWGRYYLMPAINKLITDDVSSPWSKTLYVYAEIVGGAPTYKLYDTFQIDSFNRLYIGTVSVGASAISAIAISKVTKLDNFRLSSVGIGAAIPYTSGLPTVTASIPGGWKP